MIHQTETQWQDTVLDLAALHGWRAIHHRPARTEKGWRTPVQGTHARGFPDIILVRERVVFAELKSERGRLTAEQRDWLDAIGTAGCEAYVWRPSDFDLVRAILARQEGHGS